MATFVHTVGAQVYRFASLKEWSAAKASPARSGDFAGVAALNDGERARAMALADIPLTHFAGSADSLRGR